MFHSLPLKNGTISYFNLHCFCNYLLYLNLVVYASTNHICISRQCQTPKGEWRRNPGTATTQTPNSPPHPTLQSAVKLVSVTGIPRFSTTWETRPRLISPRVENSWEISHWEISRVFSTGRGDTDITLGTSCIGNLAV